MLCTRQRRFCFKGLDIWLLFIDILHWLRHHCVSMAEDVLAVPVQAQIDDCYDTTTFLSWPLMSSGPLCASWALMGALGANGR